jgi:hypothetical protein
MLVRYYLKTASRDSLTIAIADSTGTEVTRLRGPAAAGISTVVWSTRRGGGGGRGGGAGGGGGGRGGATVIEQLMPLGRYTVTLEVGGAKLTQPAEIVKTQGWPLGWGSEVIRKR